MDRGRFPFSYTLMVCGKIWAPSLSYPVYASSAGILNIPFRDELPVSETTNFLPDLSIIKSNSLISDVLGLTLHNPTSAIAKDI